MTDDLGIVGWSVATIADKVRRREVRATEVTHAFLARVDAMNPGLNAVVDLYDSGAVRAAAALDARLDAGEDGGPLAGVPFTAKDILATSDGPTTAGSVALRDHVVGTDAACVARARAAGAILIGKTNTPEFAMWMQTSNELFGTTRSPVPGTLPGGSSGGEAAAVAARMSAFGVGTDFGGSIRWPAHCTGLVGLRPTPGRIPLTGLVPGFVLDGRSVPDQGSLLARVCSIGVLTHDVADAELVLKVLEGPDDWDSLSLPVPLGSSNEVAIGELRATWSTVHDVMPMESQMTEHVVRARDRLAGLVDSVTTFPSDLLAECRDTYNRLRQTEPLTELRRVARDAEGVLTSHTVDVLADTSCPDQDARSELWAEREMRRAHFLAAMGDVLLLPVAATPALDNDDGGPVLVDGTAVGRRQVTEVLRAVSLVGTPVVVVPVGVSPDGLPVGVQVVARPFRDDVAIAVARALHDAFHGS
jgi:amidase